MKNKFKEKETIEVISKNIDEKEIIDITRRLVEKKTVNPPGNEYLCKEIVLGKMKEIGMKTRVMEKEKGRTNVIGRIGKGSPSIVLVSHMDVVPAGDGWKTDPFKPMIKKGKIYGRGSIDNKGCFASSYAAIKSLAKSDLLDKGTIYLIAAADEEKGSKLGMEWLLKKGFKADYGLVVDGGKVNEAIIGEKGAVWFEIKSLGKQAHGSLPHLGVNAVLNLSELVQEIKKINFGKSSEKLFEGPTLNIGTFHGGEVPNIVPGKAVAKIDIRYPPGVTIKKLFWKIEKATEKVRLKNKKARFKIKVITSSKPHLLDPSHLLIRKFRKASRALGMRMRFSTIGGNTVGKDLHFKGIPVIMHLPAKKDLCHMANEYVEIKDLITCTKLYALMVYKLLERVK